MRLEGTRFGEIEIDDTKTMTLTRGVLGFPDAKRFVLLAPEAGRRIAWLQSLDVPSLAFPVVDGGTLRYSQTAIRTAAADAGLSEEDLSILVVVVAEHGKRSLTANEIAPILVDMTTMEGAQVVLDRRRYSAARSIAPHAEPRRAVDERRVPLAAIAP